jgi:hypothetical protein
LFLDAADGFVGQRLADAGAFGALGGEVIKGRVPRGPSARDRQVT